MTISREVHLKRYPVGMPHLDDFEIVETTVNEPGPGEVLVRNLWMSVDPYMRGRMSSGKSYIQPFALGEPMDGRAIGQIVRSRNPGYPEGALVRHSSGWCEHFLSTGSDLESIEPGSIPLQSYLGIMGAPGMTAWVGLLCIGKLVEEEDVFVSAAAGTVGSAACQIARIHDCRVAGSAGSPEKVAWLKEEADIDAFNYRECGSLSDELAARFPEGIDLYYENVGGEHLAAALSAMKDFGRVVACGMISTYNDHPGAPGSENLMHIVRKRIRMEGFIVRDHLSLKEEFADQMATWIGEGKIKWRETVVCGLEKAPDAFIGLFRGENIGKMLVKLSDPM